MFAPLDVHFWSEYKFVTNLKDSLQKIAAAARSRVLACLTTGGAGHRSIDNESLAHSMSLKIGLGSHRDIDPPPQAKPGRNPLAILRTALRCPRLHFQRGSNHQVLV